MITEFILKPFIFLGSLLINLLPDFSIDTSSDFLSGLNTLTANIGYILPINGLLNIFTVYLAYLSVRIGFAVVTRLKSFIPTMGSQSWVFSLL